MLIVYGSPRTAASGQTNQISEEGCKALSEIKSLTSVDIGLNKIGTAGCDYLTELPQLANLQIGKMNLGEVVV